jgi:hypothetical protein
MLLEGFEWRIPVRGTGSDSAWRLVGAAVLDFIDHLSNETPGEVERFAERMPANG